MTESTADRRRIAALVLAAGLGTRMRPFTNHVPKPLLTVNNESLLQHSFGLARTVTDRIAVNAHHLADQILGATRGQDVHVSLEPELMGTAGAVACILEWLGDRDLLILNSDTWLEEIPADFVAGWDRRRPRLLVQETGSPSDFGTYRFVGCSLLPNYDARRLPRRPSGLYRLVWEPRVSELDLVPFDGEAYDCGTPQEFIAANLAVSGQPSVIHPTATPGGPVEGSVFLANATSPEGWHSVDEIRDGFGNVHPASGG